MQRFSTLLILLLVVLTTHAQSPAVPSVMYSWKIPNKKVSDDLKESEIFRGSTSDFAVLSMTANSLRKASKDTQLEVPPDEEYLILVKDGVFDIGFNDSTWSLNKGSIALLMPAEKFTVRNTSTQEANFYLMKYRSKEVIQPERGKAQGGSMVRMWDSIPFKPHLRGGIRNYFERPTAMCRRFEMHVTTLREGVKSHEPHTHRAEEIVLVIDNQTEMQIGENFFKGGESDIYFLGSNISHAIRNDGKGTCTYFAFQFE